MLLAQISLAVPSTDSFGWWGVISLPWATQNRCQALVNFVSEYGDMDIIKDDITWFDCSEHDSGIYRNYPQVYRFANGNRLINWK